MHYLNDLLFISCNLIFNDVLITKQKKHLEGFQQQTVWEALENV